MEYSKSQVTRTRMGDTPVYYHRETETMPRAGLEALQIDKLHEMLHEIHGRNDFYTGKFKRAGVKPGEIRSMEDLSRLPFTLKSELAEAQEKSGFAYNLTYPLADYTRFHQTSGTTGKPLHVFDTRKSWEWWAHCWAHVYSGAGVTREDRIFCAFSFGPFIGFWSSIDGAAKIGALLVPGGGRSSLERLHLMRETECTVLCCTPSYALHLLEVAAQNDIDMRDMRIHTTIHAGEPGANVPAVKQRIETGWHARCHDHAGGSETGAFGFESTERPNGMYIIESEYIAEVIDPETTEPVAPGDSGELVLTNLGRSCYPVIRYRTGDLVKPAINSKGERSFLFLEGGIIGRVDDMTTVRGVNVYPGAIDNFVRKYEEIVEYRATVNKQGVLDELHLEIELAPECRRRTIREELLEDIRSTLGLRPNITLAETGSLPRFEMKAKRFFVVKD